MRYRGLVFRIGVVIMLLDLLKSQRLGQETFRLATDHGH
jgi:hypothetical protein